MINFKIGCHVSAAGGAFNAPKNAHDLGCETFQIFSRSPQGGAAPKLDADVVAKFHEEMDKYGYSYNHDCFVIHCPYFINFGSAKPQLSHGSSAIVRGELERGDLLGAAYVMTHLGSGKELGKEKALEQTRKGLVKIMEEYEGKTQFLLEIAAGAGYILGDSFKELGYLMEPLVKYKTFGGICFDTQHAFSSGYDLRTKEAITKTFKEFDKEIGLKYLKMSHVNDSKTELAGRKDRHDHIGEGKIGKDGFKELLDFWGSKVKVGKNMCFPLILETEHDKVKSDIKILKGLRDPKK